ncbi:hypothetical protein FACS189418_2840 [Clostridia bacterium]|nr:hypothetical protein FACS189418_2840 [Clostridia bacterium]
MSKIEELISEIEEYLDNCKYYPLSSTKIIVIKEELEELLEELRLRAPEEIKKYQKIVSNQEAILTDAKRQANTIVREATAHTHELINEHEIMQKAYSQANEILDEAQKKGQELVEIAQNKAREILDVADEEAEQIRFATIQYTDDMLSSIQTILENTLTEAKDRFESCFASLSSSHELIVHNRQELNVESHQPPSIEE